MRKTQLQVAPRKKPGKAISEFKELVFLGSAGAGNGAKWGLLQTGYCDF
jgi:hypothetical protein